MNRKLRTKLPVVPEVLKPAAVDRETVEAKEEAYREKYAKNYNSNHRVVSLPALEEGDKVYIRDQQRFGEVKGREVNPRSYKVQSETGTTLWRNRQSLIHIEERADQATDFDANATTSTNVTDPAPSSNPVVTPPSVDKTVRRSSRISRPNQHPEMLYY